MSLPANLTPFSFYAAIDPELVKSYDGEEGEWILEGPLSTSGKDLQGEEMDQSGLRKGLETFQRLNMPVDWDHLWERTRECRYLIGKGVSIFDADHPVTGERVPWLRAQLYKGKELAKQAKEHLDNKAPLGWSVAGCVVARDPANPAKIRQSMITSVALTPVPVVSENGGCVHFLKSVLSPTPTPLPLAAGMVDVVTVSYRRLADLLEPSLVKALTCSGALPHAGPGGDALMVEELAGSRPPLRRRKGGSRRSRSVKKALGPMLAARLCQLAAVEAARGS